MNTPDTSTATFQTSPPANFTQAVDIDGTLMGFWDGPTHECSGYEVQTAWSPERGATFFIDHDRDEAFTTSEVQDLIDTLKGILESTP